MSIDMAIDFPNISPIIYEIGPIPIRWYSLAYIAGILLGHSYIKYLNKHSPEAISGKLLEDILIWLVLGIIIGGRLGYVLFYNFNEYWLEPLTILMTWRGGLSFHGGFLGVVSAMFWFTRKHKLEFFKVTDLIAAAFPLGIGFGRIANFINGELYGRVTNVAWGVRFPHGGEMPRHPSQLYEALGEGFIPFMILFIVVTKTNARKYKGLTTGLFLLLYASARMILEYFREPDFHLGFILPNLTMGQILSFPILLLGLVIVYIVVRRQGHHQ
jgi:phosphatidylglycerol:prolipoprotein diacylglycerol transferase